MTIFDSIGDFFKDDVYGKVLKPVGKAFVSGAKYVVKEGKSAVKYGREQVAGVQKDLIGNIFGNPMIIIGGIAALYILTRPSSQEAIRTVVTRGAV